jgi:hypothetical protein
LLKKQRIYNYFYEFASEALDIVIFETFIKSMTSCLLKLKHLVFASLSKSLTTWPQLLFSNYHQKLLYWFLEKEIEFENKILSFGQKFFTACHKCGHFTGYVVTLVILTKVLFWMPAIGASPTNWRSCPRHSSWVNLGVVDFFFSLTPFCFRFSNRSKTLARFLSACRWLWKIDVDAGTYHN